MELDKRCTHVDNRARGADPEGRLGYTMRHCPNRCLPGLDVCVYHAESPVLERLIRDQAEKILELQELIHRLEGEWM